jgi:hypothetical protein
MVITIKNKNHFIARFIKPLSSLTESVVIKSDDNGFNCLANNELGVILYATYKTDVNASIQLNIPDIKRLEKIISYINQDQIELQFKSNSLSYKDNNIRFKYHFLEDGLIETPKLSIQKIQNITTDIDFQIEYSKIVELAKGASFVGESEKLYFTIDSNGVFGEITDKTNSSVDSYGVKLLDQEFDRSITFPVNFDIVRLLASVTTDKITVRLNTEVGLSVFEIETPESTLKYIVSGLQS